MAALRGLSWTAIRHTPPILMIAAMAGSAISAPVLAMLGRIVIGVTGVIVAIVVIVVIMVIVAAVAADAGGIRTCAFFWWKTTRTCSGS